VMANPFGRTVSLSSCSLVVISGPPTRVDTANFCAKAAKFLGGVAEEDVCVTEELPRLPVLESESEPVSESDI
jgi:hypothetical protein